MSKRWLAGFLIFASGFGCASLVSVATARENLSAGTLEEGLSYVNDERDVTLFNNGKHAYVVMVQREPGTSPLDAPVSYNGGTAKFSKYSLDKAIAYRLEPVAFMEQDFWRPCSMGDCSFIGPLPPPPPPPDLPDPAAVFLLSQ